MAGAHQSVRAKKGAIRSLLLCLQQSGQVSGLGSGRAWLFTFRYAGPVFPAQGHSPHPPRGMAPPAHLGHKSSPLLSGPRPRRTPCQSSSLPSGTPDLLCSRH